MGAEKEEEEEVVVVAEADAETEGKAEAEAEGAGCTGGKRRRSLPVEDGALEEGRGTGFGAD
jgi:hypothetical protein